jgi:hypothetical protein
VAPTVVGWVERSVARAVVRAVAPAPAAGCPAAARRVAAACAARAASVDQRPAVVAVAVIAGDALARPRDYSTRSARSNSSGFELA